jgi:molecular chaperone DnaK
MRYGVGIDLGTSFTSAAVYDARGTRMVPLSPELVVPSIIYAAHDGTLLSGTAAEHAARTNGEARRVARGYKRRLGDPTPLVLGGSAYSPAALMAAQLRDVLSQVEHVQGAPPDTVVLTCPAIWGQYRREHFAEVPRLAGLSESQLITEPEAAATHYSMERRLGDGEVVAVYDLGGGTFDTTILRARPDGMEILGTPEGIEHLGGVDFDEALMAHVDDRLDGAVSALDPKDPEAAATLAEIRALCVRAKEELSTEPDLVLSVPLPSGTHQLHITRLQLNDMIRPAVRLTVDALRRTIFSAGLRPENLAAILLAGGSSRVPLVGQLVHDEFGKPVRAALHPKFTVALGAAAMPARHAAPRPRLPVVDPSEPPAPVPAATRRKWVVPAVAAAVAVLLAVATTLILNSVTAAPEQAAGVPTTTTPVSTAAQENQPSLAPPAGGTAATSASSPTTSVDNKPKVALETLWIYDSGPVPPYHSLIASTDNWGGTDFGEDGARHNPIAADPDADGGLRVVWTGGSAGQIYLQNVADARDLTSYVDNEGALVFDTVVHTPPADQVKVAVHCVYPCLSEVETANMFRDMPVGQKVTTKIPLKCFVAKGLNVSMVNTPFLVYTAGKFDATFSNIRWEPDVTDATPCEVVS